MANDKKYVSIINNGSQDLYVKDSEARELISQLSPSSNLVTRSNDTALGSGEIIVGDGTTTVKTSSKTLTTTAPTSSSDNSTVPTSAAVWSAVENGIATNDAMIYKSTIAGGSTGSYGALTPTANKGWTYKVTTAGKINGISVEVGDMLICNTDNTAAATSIDYDTIVSNWDFIQTNIDGAVIGPSSSTDAHIALFNGTSGKLIKDSGFTIGKSVPSDAVFTDTTYVFNTAYDASSNKAATISDITKSQVGLSNVTNDKQIPGLSSGTTENHVITWGTNGYTVKDSGYTIGKSVPSDAVFTDTTYESKEASSGGTAVSLCTTGEKYTWNNKQASVAKLGSTTQPVYTSAAGTFAECSTYAGGTAVTLNGSSKAASTASFYAPTSAGTSGYYLKSSGSGAPTWTVFPSSLPASDVSSWAKASSKPSYSYSEISHGYATQSTSGAVSINGSTPFHVITCTGDISGVTLSTNPSSGHSCHVIFKTNSSSYTRSISIAYDATNRVTPDGSTLTLTAPKVGYVEVDFLNINNVIYVRGV